MNYTKFMKVCKETILKICTDSANYLPALDEIKKITSEDQIYEVWHSQNLINFRALLSTNVINGVYFEALYNEKTGTIDIRMYKKLANICRRTEFEDDKMFSTNDFISYCRDLVSSEVDSSDVDVILHAKVLMNHKAVLKGLTSGKNTQLLFEITSNGIKNEVYYDIYKMVDFHVFSPKYPAR